MFKRWFETNVFEHPDVIIKEWSCFPIKSDFLIMQAWRKLEKRDGSNHISDLNISMASLIYPLEQRLVISSLELEAVLKVLVETKRLVWRGLELNKQQQKRR
ncbi:hypothetical protein TorRG33x02_077620 [Trema orientale]|uniref:Uncharacterized protein n=2 Tax=Cannabaceae TaxID=3481 RepID=A0A2P5D7U3_PARAD|nr:hypothetical protein PanWU01x14_087960 [Parasponia andersonii]PON96489.1 hypothetical protein TorRG33x02_077620 [Trema orientale]